MSLEEFGRANLMVEIAVPWWNQTLWWVSNPKGIATLETEGVARGRIWTADELTHLEGLDGLQHEELRALTILKTRLDCTVRGGGTTSIDDPALAAGPAHECRTCHERRFWRSIHGDLICGLCHPPWHPRLVAEWIDGAAEGD